MTERKLKAAEKNIRINPIAEDPEAVKIEPPESSKSGSNKQGGN